MNAHRSIVVVLILTLLFSVGVLLLFSRGLLFGAAKITDEECLAFARKIERSATIENPEVLNNALSHYAFLTKVGNNLGYRNKTHLAWLSIQIRENIRFGDMVLGYLKRKDGYFNFTKLYRKRKHPHLIFRIYSQTEGLNYFDCEIRRVKGELKIVDVYIYYSGELWSSTYTRHMKLMEDYNLGDLERIHPDNSFYINILKLDAINQLLSQGAMQSADSLFQSIPALFQKDKTFEAVALKIAGQQSSEAYSKAIRNYMAMDDKDENFRIYLKVLLSLAEKKPDQTRQAIQSLLAITGDDLLMDLFVAQSYQNEQNFKKALNLYDQVIFHYPDLFETYWYKLSALIESYKYDKAVEFLDLIAGTFAVSARQLEEMLLEFQDFLNSKTYQDWRGIPTI